MKQFIILFVFLCGSVFGQYSPPTGTPADSAGYIAADAVVSAAFAAGDLAEASYRNAGDDSVYAASRNMVEPLLYGQTETIYIYSYDSTGTYLVTNKISFSAGILRLYRLTGEEGDSGDEEGEPSATFAFALPDYDTTGFPTESVTHMDAFAPPFSNMTAAASTPEISEWTRSSDAGDTFALTGENLSADLGGSDTFFMAYGIGATNAVQIQRLDGQQAALTLSTNLPSDEMYIMWPFNINGFGDPVAINQTELWWTDSYVNTGSVLRVYGQNLVLGNNDSYLFWSNNTATTTGWMTNTVRNPYMSEFTLPASMVSGTYTVYAHNGKGRGYGWSSGVEFTVITPNPWTDVETDVKADEGATGDGVTDEEQSFLDAHTHSAQWDTITIPAGNYAFDSSIKGPYFAKERKLIGADRDTTTLFCSTNSTSPYFIEGRIDNSYIKDITFSSGDNNPSTDFMACTYMTNTVFDTCRFTQLDVDDVFSGPALINLDHSDNITFTNCEFIVAGGITCQGATAQIKFIDCSFVGINDNNSMVYIIGDGLSFIDCTAEPYDISNITNGHGWTKRWINIQGDGGENRGGTKHLYVGGCTVTNLAPRWAAPWVSENPLLITDTTTTFSDLSSVSPYAPKKIWIVGGAEKERPVYVSNINYDTGVVTHGGWSGIFTGLPDATNHMALIDNIDSNSGEHIMAETLDPRVTATVTSATTNTVTISGLSSAHIKHVIQIVKGRGFGQSRMITGYSGGAVTIDVPWRVIPDTNSTASVGEYWYESVIYDTDFDGTVDGMANIEASAGVEPYGGASRLIVDGCYMHELASGYYSSAGESATTSMSLFNEIKNNSFNTLNRGLYLRETDNTSPSYPSSVGCLYRNNTFTNMENAILWNTKVTSDKVGFLLNIFDSNAFADFDQIEQGWHDDGNYEIEPFVRSNQVWVGNSCDTTSARGFQNVNDGLVFRDNDWSGLVTDYAGTLGGVLEVPIRVIQTETNVTSGSFTIWNSGTDSLYWEATQPISDWITLTGDTGDTIATNGIDLLTWTATGTAADTVIVITGGGETNSVTILAP